MWVSLEQPGSQKSRPQDKDGTEPLRLLWHIKHRLLNIANYHTVFHLGKTLIAQGKRGNGTQCLNDTKKWIWG